MSKQLQTAYARDRAQDKNALLESVVEITTQSCSDQEVMNHMKPLDRWITYLQNCIDELWLWEIFGWTLSLISMLIIGAILHAYENQRVPNWTYSTGIFGQERSFHITLNSLVSIIATVFKAALLIPVVASMSQLKWLWFQEKHPLIDFQLFEMATRGALDSLVLIWNLRARHLACLGAIIITLSLSVDFSFQFLISYPSVPLAVASAAIPRATTYSGWQPGYGDGLNSITNAMRGSILSGIYNSDTNWQVKPTCLTGNCTWDAPYVSLAICGGCVDISNQLQHSCAINTIMDTNGNSHQHDYCNSTLSNQQGISGLGYPQVSLSVVDSGTVSPMFKNMSQPITAFTTMNAVWEFNRLDDGNGSKYNFFNITSLTATECGLYYCVNKYNTSISGGVMGESVVDTWRNDSAIAVNVSQGLYYDIDLQPPISYTNASKNTSKYSVQRIAAIALRDQFNMTTLPFWTGNVTVGPALDGQYQYGSNDLATFLYQFNLTGMNKMIQSLATSMTVEIRMSGILEPANTGPAIGTAWKDVPRTHANWAWISLPAILTALTAILLVSTILKSARQDVRLWKESALSNFCHPLTHDGQAILAAGKGTRDMENIAKSFQVSYQETESGWRFVQR